MTDYEQDSRLKAAYLRGYEDGKRALDDERRAAVVRLCVLGMGDSSHTNLSRIARAIYPADYWTPPACAALRDRIIELLGGVRDDGATRSATALPDMARDVDCGRQQQAEAITPRITAKLRELVRDALTTISWCTIDCCPSDNKKRELNERAKELGIEVRS